MDTSSKLKPAEVSRIASAIDLPVYVITVVSPIDVRGDESAATPEGTLADLCRWTGGELFVTSAPSESSHAARRIIEEMRHQYLLAIEPSPEPGWHPLEVRVKGREYVVRARSGYVAGPPRPTS